MHQRHVSVQDSYYHEHFRPSTSICAVMTMALFEMYVRRHQQTYFDMHRQLSNHPGFFLQVVDHKWKIPLVCLLEMNVCCSTVLWELKYRTVGRGICESLIKVFQLIVSGSSSCLTAAALFPPGAAQQKARSNQSTLSLLLNASWLRRLTAEKRDGDEKNDNTG